MNDRVFFSSEEIADNQDNFVGIRFTDGNPVVIFPHGYRISTDAKERRKDVFRLLSVLTQFSDHKEGIRASCLNDTVTSIPLSSYQYIIFDFLENGYYMEKESKYSNATRGKINWKRTIQHVRPQFDGKNPVYLEFQVKTIKKNQDNLISKIHQYCVFQSFFRFGWLYFDSDYLPPEPVLSLDNKKISSVVWKELSRTYNDSKRKLLSCMLDIIEDNDKLSTTGLKNLSIGVNKFDPVWEKLVDYSFGDSDKKKYHPSAKWTILDDKYPEADDLSPLRIDSIMRSAKRENSLFILDAKYYQYGTKRGGLPGTSDIQKQITYGKNAAIIEQKCGRNDTRVFNAFIMPFKSNDPDRIPYKCVSVGTVGWEDYSSGKTPDYLFVLGILADTKRLLTNYTKHNEASIEQLADLIENTVSRIQHRTGS